MGWAVGWDPGTKRFRGYGVPATCEDPECEEKIDRGLAYACESEDCGRYFCEAHLSTVLGTSLVEDDEDAEDGLFHVCQRCLKQEPPYPVKPEHPDWLAHVLSDDSWAQWRSEEPELTKAYRTALEELAH